MGILTRYALNGCIVATMLAGCGGTNVSSSMPPSAETPASKGEEIFHYTGAAQTFSAPKGVTRVTVEALGATAPDGGAGGWVKATIRFTPGNNFLRVFVGGAPYKYGTSYRGGWNGGGAGIDGGGPGAGGSDVRQGGDTLDDRTVVAGGGGGAGGAFQDCSGGGGNGGPGGPGGNRIGGNGDRGRDGGGDGGTQRQGGAGGGSGPVQGESGTTHTGGSGGKRVFGGSGGGGGGGGGYYGGGGGAAGGKGNCPHGGHRGEPGAGGGGGSSFVEKGSSHVKMVQGSGHGDAQNGQITIFWQ